MVRAQSSIALCAVLSLVACEPAETVGTSDPAPLVRPSGVRLGVLPFTPEGVDSADAEVAANLHDDLIRYLGQTGVFEVVPRTAVLAYAGSGAPPSEVADVFGLDAVMDGSVRRVDRELRIEVELLDGITEVTLWSERYVTPYTVVGVSRFQADVASEVAEALQAEFSPEITRTMATPGTESIEAYECFVQGVRRLTEQGTTERVLVDRIRSDLECAVEEDPDFGRAWGALAGVYAVYPWRGWEYDGAGQAARDAVDRAVRMAPESLEARLSQGYLEYFARDYAAALGHFQEAYDRWPLDAKAVQALTLAERRAGNWERAARLAELARSLEPSAWWRVLVTTSRGLGRFDEAVAVLENALERESEPVLAVVREERFLTALYTGDILNAMTVMVDLDRGASAAERASWNARIDLYRGNYEDMLRYARGTDERERYLLAAEAAWFAGLDEERRAYADSAALFWTEIADPAPEGSNIHANALSNAGLAYALLGWRAEAIEMAGRAVEFMPVERDAFDGPMLLWRLARVHAFLGNADEALDCLERSIVLPGGYPPRLLAIDPTWDAFRDHPRMVALSAAIQ